MLSLLLLVFAAATLAWGRLVPTKLGPDEESHVLFVRTLAGDGPTAAWRWGLPVLETGAGRGAEWDDPNFEVHQPPLYYWLGVPCYKLAGLGGLRLLSLLAGLATLLLTWCVARELVAPDLALAATAVVALLPMQAFMASRVNNDNLATALWALVIWRWAVSLKRGPSAREGVWVGLGLGLALLTKQTSLVLVPTALVVAVLGAWRGSRRAAGQQLAATLAVAAGIALWWYVRNQVVYGDLFAQQAFDARFLGRRATPQTVAAQFAVAHPEWRYWPYVWEWTVRSFVIYIGMEAKGTLPRGAYPPTLVIGGLAAVGSLLVLCRRHRGLDPVAAMGLTLGCALGLLSLLYVQFNRKYFQAQGRYFFGLLPAIALVLTGGLSRPFAPGSALRRYGLVLAPFWLAFVHGLLLAVYVQQPMEG